MDPKEAERLAKEAERAQKAADTAKAKADRQTQSADAMYGRFAGGQPLLRGHHSYRSARRTKDRADAASERALDAYKAAQRAETRARHTKAKAEAVAAITSVEATQGSPVAACGLPGRRHRHRPHVPYQHRHVPGEAREQEDA